MVKFSTSMMLPCQFMTAAITESLSPGEDERNECDN